MSGVSLNREFFGALVDELAIVVGAMIDAMPNVVPGAPAMGRQWVATVQVEGGLEGTITLVLDYEGSLAVTKMMTGIDGDVPAEALADTLREVLTQAISAFALKPVAQGAKLHITSLQEQTDRAPEGEWSAHAIAADKLPAPLALTVWGAAAQPKPAEPAPAAAMATDPRIEVLLDIDLPLVVRFGQTELPLRQLTRLGPGSVIDLGRSPDDPVEVLVSNRVVARGEVVVVSGSYGIRILDVVSPRERVRSMEA
jgi:flagellar motor switch protein FliN/FliY